jgi:hypothetical protein
MSAHKFDVGPQVRPPSKDSFLDDSANLTRSPRVLAASSGESENATWQKRPLGLR